MKHKDSMNTAFLSLGGNLGQRPENMETALKAIAQHVGDVVKASRIYETEAWGSTSQKKYLNQVIKVETRLTAPALLKTLLSIESRLGRKRTANRNADRSMDLDILFFNTEILHEKALQVPHLRLHLRKFILIPLHEIEKNFKHPVLKKSISILLRESEDRLHVSVYNQPVPLRYICIEGNIGSGKSTLAQQLAKKMKAFYVPEKFDGNSLLPLFYTNPKAYGFLLEHSFLTSRFQQLTDCFHASTGLVVSDFSFYKSLWFARLNLPKKEYELFKKHFRALQNQLPEPDLIIYLDTDLKNLKQNILKRGRPYEQQISASYLEAIGKKYEQGLARVKAKKLILSIRKYDTSLELNSIRSIEKYIKENFG